MSYHQPQASCAYRRAGASSPSAPHPRPPASLVQRQDPSFQGSSMWGDARRPCFHVSHRFGRRHRRTAASWAPRRPTNVASRLSSYVHVVLTTTAGRVRGPCLTEHKETNTAGVVHPDGESTSTLRAPSRRTKSDELETATPARPHGVVRQRRGRRS